MSSLKEIQQKISEKRKHISEAALALQKATVSLHNIVAKEKVGLKKMDSQTIQTEKELYEIKKNETALDVEKLAALKKSLAADFQDISSAFLNQLNPVSQITELDDNFPILMFPLRLETRFKSTGTTSQLWLRVYPDDCNINKKEDLLTESELNNGKSYYIEMWKAGGIEAEQRGAWRSLVNSHGSGRSKWIIDRFKPANPNPSKPDASYKILVITSSALVLSEKEIKAAKTYWKAFWLANGDAKKQKTAFDVLKAAVQGRANEIHEKYKPENLSDKVPDKITTENILVEELVWPSFENLTTTRSSWTKAPKAIALPDKFVAIAYHNNVKRNILFPHPVRNELHVGPDPSLQGAGQINTDTNNDLIVNEDLKWMVDFDKAIEAGMGVKIPLSTQEAANGFDKLFVAGIRFSSDKNDSQVLLEDLLKDHFYSKEGFELIRQGTPTNNTEDEPAGYSWIEEADKSYDRFFKGAAAFVETDDRAKKADGQILAEALGIDPGILKTVPNSNGSDQLEAIAMNQALFPATLGYFMEEMMDPFFADKHSEFENIDNTKHFFTNYVSGRGPLPAIRIGKQPYGILPVSVYSKMAFSNRCQLFLRAMDGICNGLLSKVSYIGKEGDPHQILLDVIGLHPNSVEFHQRHSQSIQQIYNQLKLQHGVDFAEETVASVRERGKAILRELFPGGKSDTDVKLPILEKYFLSNPINLTGPLVDDVLSSEVKPIRPYTSNGKNYIQWLHSSDAESIRDEKFGGPNPPVALLYLLLKHSLMQAQSDAGSQLMVYHGKAKSKQAFFDPDFLHIQAADNRKSKYDNLYNSHDFTNQNGVSIKLSDYIYTNDILANSRYTQSLRETIAALQVLENVPTARLERLLIEHLDCCNYRIDAWKTGLVNSRLSKQRSLNMANGKPSKGIYLGAYGWLMDVKPAGTGNENLGYIHAPSLNQAATAAILRNAYQANKNEVSGNSFAINLTSDRVRAAADFLEGMRNGQSLSALLGYQFERGLHDKHELGQGEADVFIYPLRKTFPLVADNFKTTQSAASDSIETLQASNVIDGLKLINHFKNATSKIYPFDLSPAFTMPVATVNQQNAINKEVTRLMDVHDAISDLLLSEQVYQVVQGNFERAAGNADAFSKGGYPPVMDVINTPRTGNTITHRMAIQLDALASSTESPYKDRAGNDIISMTPKAKAEPTLNKWLSSILPDPANVLCKVYYSSPTTTVKTMLYLSQKDLGLQPIDLLYSFNLDAAQAMTELDDRISYFIRYKKSFHPKTVIHIKYTDQVDIHDRTKISFFELGTLIKSLRKILIGSKVLSASDITIPGVEQQPLPFMDAARLKDRITTLKNDLVPINKKLQAILPDTVSIHGLTEELKTLLSNRTFNISNVDALLSQFKTDVKDYLTGSISDRKSILTSFENNIQFITAQAIRTALKVAYEGKLMDYTTDFENFDQLVEDTIELFLKVSLYDNTQTGTGFIHQGISRVYDSVFSKLTKVIERWDKKVVDFRAIRDHLAGTDAEQLMQLQRAERMISSQSTFPVPALDNYKTIIDAKKQAFDSLLYSLKLLKTNSNQRVIAFIAEAEALLVHISDYDVISFDTDHNLNDLTAEKLMIVLLKEEIVVAINNLTTFVSGKITSSQASISASDAVAVNSEKIAALQLAAKKILGEEAIVLPQFTLSDGQASEFTNAYQGSESLLQFLKVNEKRVFPVDDWLCGISRVREKVNYWENISFISKAFDSQNDLKLTALQLPYQADDRWVAMKFKDETDSRDTFRINNDKLLYTAQFSSEFDATKPQCGIVIDEWTEVIPGNEETTGIAFHYNQPNSEPSQVMLLVTPPEFTGQWNWDHIIESMEETLQMAKKRAIEPAHIETSNFAQFLPATLMAVTRRTVTVATNLAVNNIPISKQAN